MPPVMAMAGWEATLDQKWQSAKENARQTQMIFAQRRLKPEEVLLEWCKNQESPGESEGGGPVAGGGMHQAAAAPIERRELRPIRRHGRNRSGAGLSSRRA